MDDHVGTLVLRGPAGHPIPAAGGTYVPRILLFRDGTGRAAARFAQGCGKRQREGFLLARSEEAGDRQPPSVRDHEQALDAELLVGLAIEPDPDRVELPFGGGPAVTDLAHAQLARGHGHPLIGTFRPPT